jgi:hypothetical protein
LTFDYASKAQQQSTDPKDGLWSIDNSRRKINRGISITHPLPSRGDQSTFAPTDWKEIKDSSKRPIIRGIALDPIRDIEGEDQGDLYVVCRGGGLCSSIEVRKIGTKESLVHIYPKCVPIGIAFDPAGQSLWILADQGLERKPYLIEKRLIGSTPQERLESIAAPTTNIRELVVQGRPVALAVTSNGIWVLSNTVIEDHGRTTFVPHVARFPRVVSATSSSGGRP